jgi:ribosomal protein S18 acetylase RimI-like enzyme
VTATSDRDAAATATPFRIGIRHPTESDHRGVASVADDWFGRRVLPLLSSAWFRHAASTSWLAEDERGRLVGFLVGYRSQDRPSEAVIHLVGVDPARRRRGVGRALVEAFTGDATALGATTVRAVAWPDDPASIAALRALGFEAKAGPGTQRLYGVPSFPNHDGPGEDRAVLVRPIR